MRASLVLGLLVAAVATLPVAADVVYEEEFFQGQPATQQCVSWQAFQAELLNKEFVSVTVSGSNDPNGVSCTDPDAATAIGKALANNVDLAIDCDGRNWRIGACGGVSKELSTAGTTCLCSNPASILRPCLTNANWGGIAGPTCSAATQTMKVVFEEAGGPSCNYITKKYKQKKCDVSGCPTKPFENCEYDSERACEDVGDCVKKLKLTSGCNDPDEKGKCKHVLSRCDCQ